LPATPKPYPARFSISSFRRDALSVAAQANGFVPNANPASKK